jgi:hypothetical protein
LSKVLLGISLICFVVASGCTSPGVHSGLPRNGQAPGMSPKLLAVYMPWFGDHTHIDVGYSSDDPAVLHKQIDQARHRGISAFVVDWYGVTNVYSDHNFALLQQAASASHFQVALLYNEPSDENESTTDDTIAAFDKAYTTYVGPNAKYRDAYLTDYDDRPMFFIFPRGGHVNWNAVREHCSSWEKQPLLIFKDQPPEKYAGDFDGSYAWVQPDAGQWAADGSNWGEQYLNNFYKTMRNKHPDKIAVGGAWPGFNDTAADWSLNRHMTSACGQTFEATLTLYQRYYDTSNPLPFLMIETWNDYEEGTAIERGTGTATNCGNGAHSASAPAGSR